MRNRQHERTRRLLSVHNAEREFVKGISAETGEVDRPALRKGFYSLNRLPKGFLKLFCRRHAPAAVPVQCIKIIPLGFGVKFKRLVFHSGYFPCIRARLFR